MAGPSRRAIARVVAAQLATSGSDGPSGQAVMQSLAAYLIDNKMAHKADIIINDIADELYVQTGRLVVEVTTAHALSAAVRDQLASYLKTQTRAASVEIHETIDERLIGGIIAKTPSAELDLSVRSKLRQLTGLAG